MPSEGADPTIFAASGDIALRPLRDARDDYELLVRWLSDPRILEWIEGRDNPFDYARVGEKYGPRALGEERVCPVILLFSGRAIGYLQYYPVLDPADYELKDVDGTWGADMWIGEPGLWSLGIGSTALRLMLDWLFANTSARRVVIDPRVENPRAVRAYEKCGFQKVKVLREHEMHEGERRDCWLMEVFAPAPEGKLRGKV